MITEIGITAGDIWHYLDKNGNATLEELMKNIGQKRELLLMSLGWLAREGHVIVEPESSGFRCKLTHS
ncbi:MAG: winged helix-turn-helix domain-containing protein [Candidatus Omnitrophica bacterium]|nr:winged helix-turn-helix domain-containing protein [Candidatus Omnitrophota bacterium]